MHVRTFLVFVLIVILGIGHAEQATRITLAVGAIHPISVPQVRRVVVGKSRVAAARVLGNEVIVAGREVGLTSVDVWNSSEKRLSFLVKVIPASELESERSRVVRVAVEFLELNRALGEMLGVKWPEAIQWNPELSSVGEIDGVNRAAGFSSTRGLIHALTRQGWAKWLSRPDLYVRLGEEAEFQSGGELPIPGGTESLGRFMKAVQWKPFGLRVRVRPSSVDSWHIQSEIQVDVSEIDRANSLEGVPAFARRNLKTKVDAIEGEPVLLSGFVSQHHARTEEGLPLLSRIPLVGPIFFSTSTEREEETELLVAVTFSLAYANAARRWEKEIREKIGP